MKGISSSHFRFETQLEGFSIAAMGENGQQSVDRTILVIHHLIITDKTHVCIKEKG